MLTINLLPAELRTVSSQVQISIRRAALVTTLALLPLGVVLQFNAHRLDRQGNALHAAWQTLLPQSAEAEQLIRQMNSGVIQQKTLLESLVVADIQWAEVLNVVSNTIPEGVWLTLLSVEHTETGWRVAIEGYGQSADGGDMISVVSQFLSGMKETLDTFFAGDVFRVETTTAREEMRGAELIRFHGVIAS